VGTDKRERQKLNRQQRLEELARQARRSKSKRLALQLGIGLPVLVALFVGVAFLVGRNDDSTTATTLPSTTTLPPITGDTPCPATDGSTAKAVRFENPPPQCIDPSKSYTALVETDQGSFTIALNAAAPINVNNFVTLARYHYYDDSSCHRVIADFVVQCGRPGDDETAPGYSVPDELPAPGTYTEAMVAMANTGQPDTGGGQFFVITGAQGVALDPTYTVLGKVTDGYDTTVKALEALADPSAADGVPPLQPITITKVTITESDTEPTVITPTVTTTTTVAGTTTTAAPTTTAQAG
jgi:cyclophilin family peptidyl-prolyl cis-trans isomerase